MTNKRLYSICMISYNQERYIADAVRGALNQTFEPIEIVISDDCSTDNTFDIIKNTIKEYRGPHHIILNRNISNLGIAANRSVAFSLATGDWIVSQDCDDISLPDRIRIIDNAINNYEGLSMIATSYYSIDEKSNIVASVPLNINHNLLLLTGATFAYRRDIHDKFGNLGKGCLDDVVLLFRALLLGKALVIDTPTVLNRENSDFFYYLKKELGYWEDIRRSYNQRSIDLELISPSLNKDVYRVMKKNNDKYIEQVHSEAFHLAYDRKKEVVNIYNEKNIAKILRNICISQSFTFTEKIKLFALSFKYFRLLKQQILNALIIRKPFSNDELLISIDDLISQKIKLVTINDVN